MKTRIKQRRALSRIPIFIKGLFMALFITILISQCTEKEEITLPDDEWGFLVFGDIRMGYGVYNKLVLSMSELSPAPKLAVCGGDIMYSGSNEVEWQAFWTHSKPITDKMKIYITRGNHEGNTKSDKYIFKQQSKSASKKFYFSFKEQNAFFIILDTETDGNEKGIFNEQLTWLKEELEKSDKDPTVEHVFLSLHRPLYPQGGHMGDDLNNAHELHDLFLLYDKIKAVLVSHDHLFNAYYRDGIPYITSGGAGGPLHHGHGGDYYHYVLISINNRTNNVNLKTIGIFNEIIEDFDL